MTKAGSRTSSACTCREPERHRILSRKEEAALSERIQQGDQAAWEELVGCNLRLVVSIARRYMGRALEFADLVQRRKETEMTRHIGYIHGFKLGPFSPPSFCQSGAALQEYIYYQKGYRQATDKPYAPEQKLLRAA